MNERLANSSKHYRVIPLTLSTSYITLRSYVNAWLTANSKDLPPGKVIQVILNFAAEWRVRDVYFEQHKVVAADTDKILPVFDCLGDIAIASTSGTPAGTIELFIDGQ